MSNLIIRIIAQNLAKKGFTSAAADVKKFDARVTAATAKLGKMTLAAAAVGAVGLSKFASFDKSIREIGTLLGDITEQDIKVMGAEIEKMSIRFGQSVEKMAKAKYDIISAGFTDAADSAKLLDVAARLASAGVTEVSKTADVLTSVLNSYGKSADDAERFSDILFTTVRLGKTTVDELASGLGRAAAIAPQVGVGFEELSAAVATLTAGGQSTDEVVTALTATMISLLKPSKELQDRIEELGFASGQAIIEEKGLAGALQDLTVGMTDTERAALFPNVRALRAVFPLVGTLADKFATNIEDMGLAAGATQTAFEKMEKGISFKLGQLRQVGEKVLRRFGALMADLVTSFLDAEPATQNLIVSVTLLGAAFKFLGGPITLLVAAATAVYQAWKFNIGGFRQLITELAEDFTSMWNRLVIEVGAVSKIIRDVMNGNWMLIGFDIQQMEEQTTQELKRHSDARIKIAEEFANAYVGTFDQIIPDASSLFGFGDTNTIGEKGAETVAAVNEAVIVPITALQMDAAVNTSNMWAEQQKIAGVHIMQHNQRVTKHIANQWSQNARVIKQNMVGFIGQQASNLIGNAFDKLIGEQKTAFGQLWSAVLRQFIQMVAAMTARWLAFKALTAVGFSPLSLFFARGGVLGEGHMPKVKRAQTGMIAQGFDTVPAMLRRGEAVIPAEQTRDNLPAIKQLIAGQQPSGAGAGGGRTINITNNISAIDSESVADLVRSGSFTEAIVDAINDEKINIKADNTQIKGNF
jgi:TP901 family phage tail tape measure protein